jgi:hypothetical protein
MSVARRDLGKDGATGFQEKKRDDEIVVVDVVFSGCFPGRPIWG